MYETEVLGRSVRNSSRRTDIALLEALARQDRAEVIGRFVGNLLGDATLTLGKGLKAVAYAVEGWRQRRATYGELTQLDDRLLADIGIQRADIPAIAEVATHKPLTGSRVGTVRELSRTA
ncbi:MAG: DUF1127 domain-containing protein [Alphaproteobacteria bacterium]|nr:DUF1127 domain-containing protein [Alphaproteobacteria bacterium]